MKIRMLVSVLALSSMTAIAAESPPPLVEVETSADGPVTVVVTKGALSSRAAPRALSNPNARIIVNPVRMIDKANAAWPNAAALVVGDVRANALRVVPNAISGPSDYSAAPYITWSDVVSNPNQEELWYVVRGFSTTGANDVSLGGTTVTFESPSDGGQLNATVTFGSLTYTPYAPLIMQNGSTVTSGATSQQGQRFIVLVHIKSFDGSSQANLNSAQSWVTQPAHMPYVVKCTAQMNADSAVWRSVSTDTPFDDGRVPLLLERHDPSGMFFSVPNAFTNRFYTVWGRGSLTGGRTGDSYPDAITLGAAESPVVPYYSPTNRFFDVQLQQ